MASDRGLRSHTPIEQEVHDRPRAMRVIQHFRLEARTVSLGCINGIVSYYTISCMEEESRSLANSPSLDPLAHFPFRCPAFPNAPPSPAVSCAQPTCLCSRLPLPSPRQQYQRENDPDVFPHLTSRQLGRCPHHLNTPSHVLTAPPVVVAHYAKDT